MADADPGALEQAESVGGTRLFNRCPGARCTGYTGGIPERRWRCDEIAASGYRGFELA